MRDMLEQLSLSTIFICKVIMDNEMNGRIIMNNADFPASGLPARELKILTKPDEFKRMSVHGGELVFWYKV